MDITGICDGSLWRCASGRALVIVAGDRNDLYAGEPVELAGQIARVAGPLNPGEFDYRAYLRSKGIRLRIVVDNSAGIGRRSSRQRLALHSLAGARCAAMPKPVGRSA